MRENLDDALKLMFGDEGGYVNRKSDSGGPTKYGITHKTLAAHRGVKSVSADQVKALTLNEAEAIYRQSYWGPSGGDVLPAGLDYAAFDFGVNSGPITAVKKLQKTVGVPEDGWIGPKTLNAVKSYPGGVAALIVAYCEERMNYLRSLKSRKTGFPVNGRGWTIRVTGKDPEGKWAPRPGVVGHALEMAKSGRANVTSVKSSMPAEVQDEAVAKAEPKTNPWLTPEMVTTVGGGVAASGGTVLASGADPIRIATAIGIVAAVALGAFFIYRRLKKTGTV